MNGERICVLETFSWNNYWIYIAQMQESVYPFKMLFQIDAYLYWCVTYLSQVDGDCPSSAECVHTLI